MIPDQEILKIAWFDFICGGKKYEQMLRPVIRNSWNRCRNSGVDTNETATNTVLDPVAIKERLNNNQWLDIARSVMETLHHFVKGSGFLVTVCDGDGFILEVIGDSEIVEQARQGNWIKGGNWSEKNAGTNAMGTALVIHQPLQVFGYEHYIKAARKWTCSAAIICNPEGQRIGALSMSGSIENVHLHTLGMVVAGADAIERQLAIEKAWLDRDKANRVRDAIMESISEGILAIDERRRIIHINPEACRLLDINAELSIGKSIDDVAVDVGAILPSNISDVKSITDQEFDIATSIRKTKLIITSRPICGDGGHGNGVVLVINAHTRARKLAQHISGAVAKIQFDNLMGESSEFKETLRIARLAAGIDSTVLLLGESGTGKDILAQAIHNGSDRNRGPFVAINCGAIPRDLITSELFGYNEGAFTGARRGGQPGKFELAEGGTLFLDEIGEMPAELQVALLRVLEQKAITRVGGSGLVPVNVRVIAATHKDLHVEMEKGRFRRDLYYRLNVFTIQIPPLRKRVQDAIVLFKYFIEKMGERLDKADIEIDAETLRIIAGYNWPGNVRELQNVVERALHLGNGPILLPDHLPEELRAFRNVSPSKNLCSVSDYEKDLIERTIESCHGNLTHAAAQLKMARTTLYRKLDRYGIRDK